LAGTGIGPRLIVSNTAAWGLFPRPNDFLEEFDHAATAWLFAAGGQPQRRLFI
jgi:hypothetical protein